MRGLQRRAGIALISFTLLISLASPIQSQALSNFKVAPATVWGHVYAGPAATTTQTRAPKVAYLEQKSKFVVNYKNFTEWAKKDFQSAVDVWSTNFSSKVSITIDAAWIRSASSSILGSARPGSYFAGFDGAPDASLWYPSALANALAGKDLDPSNPEMVIQVNSSAGWNTRNDGAPRLTEYDLQSVFLHEMGHGLGFLSTDSYDNFFGYGSIEQPTPYNAYAQLPDGRRLSDLPSPSIELGKALTSTLVWSGALGIAANGGTKPLLYTPLKYEEGSSVSHLDEATYKNSELNRIMTPNLDAGEVFREPGPLLLAMMEDMRRKPPLGLAVGVPQGVRNATALISDSAAIVTFDPPANARTSQVSLYTVRNLKTDEIQSSATSPITFTGLKNGTSYSFSIIASNSNGSSEAVITAPITPQKSWKRFVIDDEADVLRVATITFNRKPTILYTDSTNGRLKIATWEGKKWKKLTVDGAGGTSPKTRNPINGHVSTCVNGSGTTQTLHIFYSEKKDKDLHYASYDGKKFIYEIVDGNGTSVNDYKDATRFRTASDVSVSSACVATAAGVQVFYRDESQGILLGASRLKSASKWNYELIDGDRKTDGRSTGDVAFHLRAAYSGAKTYILYDSVLTINQRKQATSGEVRVASRNTFSTSPWTYFNLDTSGSTAPMTGFDVSIAKNVNGLLASWLIAAPATMPNAAKIRWSYIQPEPAQNVATTENYGAPTAYLNTDGTATAFNCSQRLCVLDHSRRTPTISLVSPDENLNGISSGWIVIDRVRYLIASYKGQLSMFRP
jgi:hypothetical protein